MAFNMMALMNEKSRAKAAGEGKFELKKIPLDKLIPNPANEKIYETGEIEELAQSILLTGKVLQNAVVTAADEAGNYTIIAGHRRHIACQKLVADGYSEFGEIPCFIMNEPDGLLQELALIQTNSTARVLSDAEKVRQAERATAILTELKDRKQISGRVRDIVAKMLGTTKSQIGRYNVISKGLTNETLRESFEKGKMGVSAAYEAARMDEAAQEELAAKVEAGENVSIKDVMEQKEKAVVPRTKCEAARAKMEKEGYEALTDCEKCKITTCCEDCCRTCPPENRCNVGQCQIDNRLEQEKAAAQRADDEKPLTEAPAPDSHAPDDQCNPAPQKADDMDADKLQLLWLRGRALKTVITDLQARIDFESLQLETDSASPVPGKKGLLVKNVRARTSRMVLEIFKEYLHMAKKESKEIHETLGEWEELFEQDVK